MTPTGDRHRDRIEAASPHELRAIIRRRSSGARVIRWNELNARAGIDRRLKEADLLLFLELSATQLDSGIPQLEILEPMKDSPAFERATKAVLEGVFTQVEESKGNLSQGLERYPKAFPKELIVALKVGEKGGPAKIAESMRNFVDQRTFKNALRSEAIAASVYPGFLMLLVAGLFIEIFYYVLPKLEPLVALTKDGPPEAMRRLLAISAFFRKDGLGVLVGLVGVGVASLLLRATQNGRRWMDRLLLGMPIIGPIVKHYAVANVTKSYRGMYLAGELPGPCLEVCADGVANSVVKAALLRSKGLLEKSIIGKDRGRSPIAEAFRVTGVFPSVAVTIIANGEKTATLGNSLERVSKIYAADVRKRLKVALNVYTKCATAFAFTVGGYVVFSVWQTIIEVTGSF